MLIVPQVAAALILLVGAGLLTKSFRALQEVSLGMEPEGVLAVEVSFPDARYSTPQGRVGFP